MLFGKKITDYERRLPAADMLNVNSCAGSVMTQDAQPLRIEDWVGTTKSESWNWNRWAPTSMPERPLLPATGTVDG
jgi:hypothetical protein